MVYAARGGISEKPVTGTLDVVYISGRKRSNKKSSYCSSHNCRQHDQSMVYFFPSMHSCSTSTAYSRFDAGSLAG